MFLQENPLAEAPLSSSRMRKAGFWDRTGTFKGVLVYDEQVMHFYLLSKGCLVWSCAAGKQLAGAHAAGQGLGNRKIHHIPVLLGYPHILRQPVSEKRDERTGGARNE